jgi:hypothetical protein
VGDGGACAGRLGKQVERLISVVADRSERLVHIIARTGAIHDGRLPNQQPYDRAGQDHVLNKRVPTEARPEEQGVLARQARPALGRMLESEDSALQRMYVFEAIRRRKSKQVLG